MANILDLDFRVFYWVHVVAHNTLLDYVFPFIRNPYFWAPLYLFLLVFMIENYKRKGWDWIYYFFISFAIGDIISSRFLKPLVHRTRPCMDSMWHEVHRNLVPVSHGFSFPSSHATNHFALSVFIIITCSHKHKSIKWLAMAWAVSVAYAQVYVGVHYPLDVIAGALLGTLIGYYMGNYYNLRKGLL
jgi:membrane-associated phospholipid phosphatase